MLKLYLKRHTPSDRGVVNEPLGTLSVSTLTRLVSCSFLIIIINIGTKILIFEMYVKMYLNNSKPGLEILSGRLLELDYIRLNVDVIGVLASGT